eukprot:6458099-Amphidinium_carterae.1
MRRQFSTVHWSHDPTMEACSHHCPEWAKDLFATAKFKSTLMRFQWRTLRTTRSLLVTNLVATNHGVQHEGCGCRNQSNLATSLGMYAVLSRFEAIYTASLLSDNKALSLRMIEEMRSPAEPAGKMSATLQTQCPELFKPLFRIASHGRAVRM